VNVYFVNEHRIWSSHHQLSGLSCKSNDQIGDDQLSRRQRSGGLDGQDADDSSTGAVVLEPDPAGDLGKNRVVLATARIDAGLEPATALTHDDRAARNQIAVVCLDTEPLGIRIAAVA
jgi:hypothetical protein